MNKYFLILSFMFCCSFSTYAQTSFTVNPDTSYTQNYIPTGFIINYSYVYNHTNDTIWLHWNRVDTNVPINWDVSICDEWISYPPFVTNGNFYVLPNDSSPLLCQFYSNYANTADTGTVHITFWDPLDSINSAITATYIAVILANTSINESDNVQLNIYPNPANDFIYISSKIPGDIMRIRLISIDGKTSRYFESTENTWILDVSDLAAGNYSIVITDKKKNLHSRSVLIH